MANQRFDVLSPRKFKTRDGEEKTAWSNVGIAFESRNKDGFDVTLHLTPIPVDGMIRLVVRLPKEKEEGSGGGQPRQRQQNQDEGGGGGGGGNPDDDIPF